MQAGSQIEQKYGMRRLGESALRRFARQPPRAVDRCFQRRQPCILGEGVVGRADDLLGQHVPVARLAQRAGQRTQRRHDGRLEAVRQRRPEGAQGGAQAA